MPRSSRFFHRLRARGAGTPRMPGPFYRSPAASVPSLGHLVNGHDDEQLGLGVWLDDHHPGDLTTSGLDHESTRHDAGPVARSSIARTSTSVTPRCSMRDSAWPVNERSQFHHSGKVAIAPLGGPIVAPGHTQRCRQISLATAGRVLSDRCSISASRGEHQGEQPFRARCSPWIGPRRRYVLVDQRDSRAPSASGNC
jgi:hypothetical protein